MRFKGKYNKFNYSFVTVNNDTVHSIFRIQLLIYNKFELYYLWLTIKVILLITTLFTTFEYRKKKIGGTDNYLNLYCNCIKTLSAI